MSRVLSLVCLTVVAAGASWAQSVSKKDLSEVAKGLVAPGVGSPYSQVDRMLDLAALKPGETLYDLGCGDGRILIAAAQKYRAKAIGVELLPLRVKDAREAIQKVGLQDLASVVEGDARDIDLSKADVVTIYMTTDFNDELKPKLEKQLHAGARVVTFEFEVPGWKPQRMERLDTDKHDHKIFVYRMPPTKK